jgi:hypothetical protein
MSNEIETKVDELLREFGTNYSVRYVGETVKKDWGADGKGQTVDHFRFTIGDYSGDFFMGLGNRKASRPMPASYKGDRYATRNWEHQFLRPVAPSAAAVLYSLLSDGEAVNQSFSDWCYDLGYDSDSIKALRVYQQCEETGRELRRLFKLTQVQALRNALQDY